MCWFVWFPKDGLSKDTGGVRCKTENKSVNQDLINNSPKVYRQLIQRDKTIRVLGEPRCSCEVPN